MNLDELFQARFEDYKVYGWFYAYCKLTSSCDVCDRFVRLGCKAKKRIENMQTKRILRVVRREEK